MKRSFVQLCMIFCLCTTAPQAMAMTDTYFTTGEDIDFLIESDNTLAIQEIEYELRKFVIFRKIEDYLFNLSDEYFSDDE